MISLICIWQYGFCIIAHLINYCAISAIRPDDDALVFIFLKLLSVLRVCSLSWSCRIKLAIIMLQWLLYIQTMLVFFHKYTNVGILLCGKQKVFICLFVLAVHCEKVKQKLKQFEWSDLNWELKRDFHICNGKYWLQSGKCESLTLQVYFDQCYYELNNFNKFD